MSREPDESGAADAEAEAQDAGAAAEADAGEREVAAQLAEARPALDDYVREVMRAQVAAALFGSSAHVTVGRYELRREVGTGGGGSVFLAWDPELAREVALKLIVAPSARLRERALAEGQALARLSHPNVVPVFDVGVEHGSAGERVYLVMERAFTGAAPAVFEAVRGVRPRLVFGQLMLTEALRVLRAGLTPALLECAKLLALRRNLAAMMPYGASQLLFEQYEEDGRLRCGVHNLESGQRLGELLLPADAIAEARASSAQLEGLYPKLFGRPYVSACRYLAG